MEKLLIEITDGIARFTSKPMLPANAVKKARKLQAQINENPAVLNANWQKGDDITIKLIPMLSPSFLAWAAKR